MPAYFDAARKTWYVKFRYRDWQGKTRETTKRGFATKREARAYEESIKREANDSPDMTVKELCERYLAAHRAKLRESSMREREQTTRIYIIPPLGALKLSELTRSTIEHWQDWLTRQTSRLGKPLSPTTIRQRNLILQIILKWAVKNDWLVKSPCDNLRPVGRPLKRLAFYEADEYARFIDVGRQDNDFEDYHLAFDMLFYGGFRIAELQGIGVGDIDFERKVITLRRGVDENGKVTGLKNPQSYRSVPMPAAILDRLRGHLAKYFEPPPVGIMGISNFRLRRKMKLWAGRAGLPYITLHGLRHSHVSYLISLGVSVVAISKRIGHNSPKTTLEVYSHMYERVGGEIAELLDGKITGTDQSKK